MSFSEWWSSHFLLSGGLLCWGFCSPAFLPPYQCKGSSTERWQDMQQISLVTAACWFSCDAFDLELAHVSLAPCTAEEALCACTFPCICTLSVWYLLLIVIFELLCIVSACLFLKFSDRDSWYSGKFSRDLIPYQLSFVNENLTYCLVLLFNWFCWFLILESSLCHLHWPNMGPGSPGI